MSDTYERLNEIFRDIFDDDDITLTAETTPEDIEGWDSLANINIIISIEEEFGIKFAIEDIQHSKCVGDMVKVIEERVA